MVQSIEQYGDVLKVILKPTTKNTVGNNYFYCDAIARELVENYSWSLDGSLRSVNYVRARLNNSFIRFHRAYADYLGVSVDCIDHCNGVGRDNRDTNLFVSSTSTNAMNRPSKGYSNIRGYFQPYIKIEDKLICCGYFKNELDAIKTIDVAKKEHYKEHCYDFLLDRRGDLDILDDELTGKITSEEATFRHVMRYAKDNAWYVYRYGLEEYFSYWGIKIPAFELDSKGYMINTITKERLCPFK